MNAVKQIESGGNGNAGSMAAYKGLYRRSLG